MVPQKTLDYRGCVIAWPEIRIDGARWTVNLASDNPSLIGRSYVFNNAAKFLRALFNRRSST